MSTYDKVITRWLDVAMGRTDRALLRHDRMPTERNRIYSYGSHFEIARVLRDKDDKPIGFLLNGARWGNTTTRHQGFVRDAINREGLPSVIIPHEALNAAGVNLDTVQIVDVTRDRTEEINHVVYEQPAGSQWRTENIYETVRKTDDELAEMIAEKDRLAEKVYQERVDYATEENDPNGFWAKWIASDHNKPKKHSIDDLSTHYYGSGSVNKQVLTGTREVLYASSTSHRVINVEKQDDGRTRYSWTTYRHWLGESVIKARLDWTERKGCTSCLGGGATAEITHDMSSEQREALRCKVCRGHGIIYKARSRWTYFLSGFDQNEPRPSYFFCELAKGVKPTTVDEAYDTLKPESVKLAEQMGRTVLRQGDIYFMQMPSLDKRTLRKMGAEFAKSGTILGTNHVASEVAVLPKSKDRPNGVTLARGTARHAPQWRRPDHVRVTLGDRKGWWMCVKNTVPLAR